MYREDVPYLTLTPHQHLEAAWTCHINQLELSHLDHLFKPRELAAEGPETTVERLEAVEANAQDVKHDAVVEK